jgi:hypothetical protein
MRATYHRYFGVRPSPICRSLLPTACWNARETFFREAHARAQLVARHSWQILSSPNGDWIERDVKAFYKDRSPCLA